MSIPIILASFALSDILIMCYSHFIPKVVIPSVSFLFNFLVMNGKILIRDVFKI